VNKRRAAREPEALPQPDLFGEADRNIASTRRTHKEKPRASSVRAAPTNPASGLLNVRQAALRLGLSKSTLDKMRPTGKGPKFVKTTDRAVRYDPADLDQWIAARRKQTNND
jgi:predicted DNA-binding transcriptional regulator AlpA